MSGPIQDRDALAGDDGARVVEVREGRRTQIGATRIARVLPTKGRRTVGPWCFVDLIIPPDADDPDPMEIGPHPHIGLSTVTWLLDGEALHGDSLGTEQVIRPGQLNLMTAGHGIAHAELSSHGGVRGVQMWVAQPEDTRHGTAAFEHHAELPRRQLGSGEAVVLMGALGGVSSPARFDTPLVGAELTLRGGPVEVPAEPGFEYAVAPIDSSVSVDGHIVEPGWLGLVPPGSDLLLLDSAGHDGRVLLLGGGPLVEPIQMWWNFVARSKDEITAAWRAWQEHDTDRFGPVPSDLERMDAPTPPWLPAGA